MYLLALKFWILAAAKSLQSCPTLCDPIDGSPPGSPIPGELGGTSLMVTRVIIEADKAGVHVAYGDVFANPTPQLLANFINGGATATDGAQSGKDEVSGFDYNAINNLLQRNTLLTFQKGERQKLGKVLLTGPTGYLGIHVLRELIDSDAEEIYCMATMQVRPVEKNARADPSITAEKNAADLSSFSRRASP